MAYGVYWRRKGDRAYGRASEIVKATKGKFKGTNIARDLRFETLEAAEEKAKSYEAKGYETKIKEVK